MNKGNVVTLKAEYRHKSNHVLPYGTRLTITDTLTSISGVKQPHPLYLTFDEVPDVENENFFPAVWFRTVDEDELR